MAPQDSAFDPDRIDISLDLIGSGSLEAVQALTQALHQHTVFVANAQARSPEGAAAGLQAIGNSLAPTTGTVVPDGSHLYASLPSNSPSTQDGAGQGASLGWVAQRLENYRRQETEQLKRRSKLGMGDPSGSPYQSLYSGRVGGADEELGGAPGSVSSGASLPDDTASSNDPLWRQALMSNPVEWERSQEGIRLPPGGLSLNIQDKLRIASDFLAQRANARYTSAVDQAGPDATGDSISAGNFMGSTAGLLRIGSEHAAQVQLVAGDLRNYAQRATNYAGGYQQAGVAAGYDRAGQVNIPGTNIGITNPLDFFNKDSAAREGLNQRVNTMRLRMMGGINGEQAQQIVGGLAGMGWTGEQGESAAFNALAPLVQQGMNPALATQSFDDVMRQGNSTISNFVQTMDHLGRSAQAANMSLDEYQQGLEEFAQKAKQLGAVGAQGYQLGRDLTDSLGVAPQVAATFFDNPLVQGQAMAQTGVLPNAMGLLGAHQTTNALYGAIDMAMKGTAGFANRPSIVDPTTGHRISGKAYQVTEAASLMGMDRNLLQRLLRQRGVSQHAAAASELLHRYHGEQDRAATRGDLVGGRASVIGDQSIGVGDWVPSRSDAPGAIRMPDGTYAVEATAAGHGDVYSATGNDAQWKAIKKQLMGLGPGHLHDSIDVAPGHKPTTFADQVSNLEKLHGQARIDAAQKLIRDTDKVKTNQGDAPTVYVKFKGAAAKLFEQDGRSDAKKSANAGGSNLAEAIISPQEANLNVQAMVKQFGLNDGG